MKLFCPSCGSPIEFRYDDSFVRVCTSCRSAIVRTDRGIDSFGQIADLTPTRSGLALGDRGRYRGEAFELMGRAEYGHPGGGRWEEWFLKLADGRWAWLGEAQGEWVITFERSPPPELPRWSELVPSSKVALGHPPVMLEVGERNVSTSIAAEGELPFQFIPGAQSCFADLSDGKGRFATLDYGAPGSEDAVSVYVGQRVKLAELGLAQRAQSDERDISGDRLACPNCGGSIELLLPGSSLSVACPYCASVLDCEGPLTILALHQERTAPHSPIALGASGVFDGVRYVVTGRLQRRARYDGMAFTWDEFLLHAPGTGYRWLVNVRGHWSFVRPIAPGSVQEGSDGVYYAGRRFALYDAAQPEVSAVWGEFYWKVRVGETVQTRDFIAPPAMLSYEWSENEVHWSLGMYQTPEDIRRAFELDRAPSTPDGIAANQPFPHPQLTPVIGLVAAGFVLCTFLRVAMADPRQVYSDVFQLGGTGVGENDVPRSAAAPAPGVDSSYVLFTPEFDLSSRQNTRVSLSLPVTNSWAYASVDLIHEASGQFRSFGREIAYYYGSQGGESWSEGGQSTDHVLPADASGRHLLRIEVQTPSAVRLPLRVKVEQDVFPWSHLGWAFLALGVPGTLLGLYHWGFERRRWAESDHAPGIYAAS